MNIHPTVKTLMVVDDSDVSPSSVGSEPGSTMNAVAKSHVIQIVHSTATIMMPTAPLLIQLGNWKCELLERILAMEEANEAVLEEVAEHIAEIASFNTRSILSNCFAKSSRRFTTKQKR